MSHVLANKAEYCLQKLTGSSWLKQLGLRASLSPLEGKEGGASESRSLVPTFEYRPADTLPVRARFTTSSESEPEAFLQQLVAASLR